MAHLRKINIWDSDLIFEHVDTSNSKYTCKPPKSYHTCIYSVYIYHTARRVRYNLSYVNYWCPLYYCTLYLFNLSYLCLSSQIIRNILIAWTQSCLPVHIQSLRVFPEIKTFPIGLFYYSLVVIWSWILPGL